VIAQCLEKDPDRRFASAHDVRAALERIRPRFIFGGIIAPTRRTLAWTVAVSLRSSR
jgi:hypothetical protein